MPKQKLFAAIEVGSSAIAMKIAQISKKDGINVIDEVQYGMQIGADTYSIGKIRYPMVEKICYVIGDFKRIMREYGVTDYRACAASAIREASNSEYIIDQIGLRTGIKLETVSSSEEHFLYNKAVAMNSEVFDEAISDSAMLIDVSSGSVQISNYENSRLKHSRNIRMGTMRVHELLSELESRASSFSSVLEEYIHTMFSKYRRMYHMPEIKSYVLYGSGISHIKNILIQSDNDYICYDDIKKAYSLIKHMSKEDICDKYEISPEYAELLLPSVIICRELLSECGEKLIWTPDVSLSDGLCIEYAERFGYTHTKHIFTSDIFSAVEYLAQRYNCDENHYKAVASYAEAIAGVLSKKFGISKSDMTCLKVAAIIEDAGLFMNINSYSRYSHSIVCANTLPGLSEKDKEIVEYTVLYHAGRMSMDFPENLSKHRRLTVSKLVAILSLANALDVSYSQKFIQVGASLRDGVLRISALSDGSDTTLEEWQFAQNAEFFEEVFGIRAVLGKRRTS